MVGDFDPRNLYVGGYVMFIGKILLKDAKNFKGKKNQIFLRKNIHGAYLCFKNISGEQES